VRVWANKIGGDVVGSNSLLGRTMSRRKKESVDFEDYIYADLRRKFPLYLGWNFEQERTLMDGSRADYCLYRVKYGKKERAVAEAKNVVELTTSHLEQLDHYSRRYHASYRLMYIPSKTSVDSSVRDYADNLSIQIVRTRF